MRSRRSLYRELFSFALVGGVGFLLDVAVFNLLYFTVLSPHTVAGGPLLAKVASTTVATAANWVGNRWLTFHDRRRTDVLREAAEFGLTSVSGSLIALLCLGVSHYGLHLVSPLADNISANVVGLILGSAFRFVVYRQWVYSTKRSTRQRALLRP